jgi:hypothetical protein
MRWNGIRHFAVLARPNKDGLFCTVKIYPQSKVSGRGLRKDSAWARIVSGGYCFVNRRDERAKFRLEHTKLQYRGTWSAFSSKDLIEFLGRGVLALHGSFGEPQNGHIAWEVPRSF